MEWRYTRLTLCCGLLSVLYAACSPWDQLEVVSQNLYRPLAERDLNAFEQRLAHLQRSGASGDALIVATQWLYLLTCHPIPLFEEPKSPLWRAIYASLYLEETRSADDLGQLTAYLKGDPSPLQLEPKMLPPELWMTWPKDVEGWPDEAPSHISLPRQCKGETGRKAFDPESGVTLPSTVAQRIKIEQEPRPQLPPKSRALLTQLTKLILPSNLKQRAALWRRAARLGWGLKTLSALEELSDQQALPPLLRSWAWWPETRESWIRS